MNIKLNLQKILSLKGVTLTLVMTSALVGLTGCGQKADCNISESHAHLYTNEQGYIRYIDKEYLKYENYDRCDESISIEGQEKLYKFLDKKDLMKIEDNLELLVSEQEKNCDYVEYRYKYTYMQPIPHTMSTGKSTITYFTYVPHTRYSWTANPNKTNLTGETRVCHYVYNAYKIEVDEDGKYVLIPSEDVEDLRVVMDEYPYIKQNFSKLVNLDGEVLDYEDGKEEDLTEEERKRAQEYVETEAMQRNEDLNKTKVLSKSYF